MTKQTLEGLWDQLRQKYGVYLRVLEAIPEDRFTTSVIGGMRTPAEMVAHVSGGIVRDIAQGVERGEITQGDEAATVAELKTKADAIAFAEACWQQADAAVGAIGDEHLSAIVQTPWNMSFPGSFGFTVINDEFVHHRGQLYAYVRASGAEPPFMWGFAENGQDFAPQA